MRPRRAIESLVLACIVAAVVGARLPPAPAAAVPPWLAAPVDPPPEEGRLMLAVYYGWFDWSVWTQPLCDQPQTLYVSADVTAVARHLSDAARAGIDGLVMPWYGPALADNPTDVTLDILMSQAVDTGVKVAVMLDLTSDHLSTMKAVAEAVGALRALRVQEPAYLALRGRPVVFFLHQSRHSLAAWEAVRNSLDPDGAMVWLGQGPDTAYLTVFDGLYLYDVEDGVLTATAIADAADEVRDWSSEAGSARLWVATTLPGYDDRSQVASDAAVVEPRRQGRAYEESWAAAAATDPDAFLIRSLNEWTHCTHIEPSVGHGETYLDLTASLARAYRFTPTPPATETPTPTSTVGPTLTPTAASPVMTSTPIVTPTSVVLPTKTVTPTATPLRLATPTPTGLIPNTPAPGSPTWTPSAVPMADGQGPVRPDAPAATGTPIPRLPVEGGGQRRCMPLPAALPVLLAAVSSWWRARRSRRCIVASADGSDADAKDAR